MHEFIPEIVILILLFSVAVGDILNELGFFWTWMFWTFAVQLYWRLTR